MRPRHLLLLILFCAAVPASAQIGVSPPVIEMPFEVGSTARSIDVINFGSRDVDVRVRVQNFDLDEANAVRILPSSEQSLDQWIVFQPGSFELPAGKSQTIRFALRPKVAPTPGEHRAMVFFEEQPRPDDKKEGVRVLFRMGAAVYVHVGGAQRVGEILGVDPSAEDVAFDISSTGTALVRMDGTWAIWPADAYPGEAKAPTPKVDAEGNWPSRPQAVVAAGRLPLTPVLPGTRRRVHLRLPASLKAGDYFLHAEGSLSGENAFRKGTRISIAEKPKANVPDPATGPTPRR